MRDDIYFLVKTSLLALFTIFVCFTGVALLSGESQSSKCLKESSAIQVLEREFEDAGFMVRTGVTGYHIKIHAVPIYENQSILEADLFMENYIGKYVCDLRLVRGV